MLQPTIVKAQSINQAPAIAWQRILGEQDTEALSNIVQTSDGGYAFLDCGWSHQFTFTPSTLYKVDSSGNLQWTKVYEGFTASTLVQTRDGGYEISGEYGGTPSLIKTDSAGNIQWVKNYTSSNYIPDIGVTALLKIQTSDGGSASVEQNSTVSIEQNIVVKTDSNGNVQWTKDFNYFDPAGWDLLQFKSLIETSDGAILGIGINLIDTEHDRGDIYLVKTDAFLPLPSSTELPNPMPPPNNIISTLILPVTISTIVVLTAGAITLLLYRSHRKTDKVNR